MTITIVYGGNPTCVLELYQKLLKHVQWLETMKKLNTIKWYMRNTLNKLPQIRSALLRLDGDWQQQDFPKLKDALRQWVERAVITDRERQNTNSKIQKLQNINKMPQIESVFL